MPDQAVEPDDDEDVNEIVSSLKHEFEELPGPPGGNLIKTVVEKRGIRKSTRPIYADPLENFAQENILGWTPEDTYALLFMAANRHLRAKGEMDFFAVCETAENIAHAEGKDPSETTSRHFLLWLEKMKGQTGALSIETAAAGFIRASDRLFMLLNENAAMQAAAHDYADAWHWLHMELMGEHELAAKGSAAERGRKVGPEAKRRLGALRSAIIAQVYEKFAAGEARAAYRNSASHAADAIFEEVNRTLEKRGIKQIASGTIANQLSSIIKAAKAKRG